MACEPDIDHALYMHKSTDWLDNQYLVECPSCVYIMETRF
jgi:hypothetical protein